MSTDIATRVEGDQVGPGVRRDGNGVVTLSDGRDGQLFLTLEQARWLFAVAGPMVLIALRDAQQNAEPKREKRWSG